VGKKIHLVYDFSEFDKPGDQNAAPARQELNIPQSAFVIGGSGSIEWRKGTDLFLQIALRSVAEASDLRFLWVGGKLAGWEQDYDRVLYDLERMDLSGKVIITGKQRDVTGYFAAIELFALTSREDPFPLVCLEAASLGKPIICFAGAGGMPEFVGDDAGAVVPYGDVSAFSDRILHFYQDREALVKAGAAARTKVTTSFRLADSCRRLSEIVLGL
jgi:glycosyltransferase involved in cell wall biosynthesis